jgi:beta-barrel assembly-enhancing protease
MTRLRARLTGALLAAAAVPAAAAAPAPESAPPPIPVFEKGAKLPPWTSGYKPADKVEQGLWMQVDEAERELRTSKFVIRDPALNDYVRGVLCRTVGEERCGATRLYIVRSPYFNATMAPNGMMQVWTGLLLRVRNEAQLAAVLGHEFGHFEKRDGVRLFRDMRRKTNAMTWLSFLPYGVGLVASFAVAGSIFEFNRDMERDADINGLRFIAHAGYSPKAFSGIWMQLRAEMDATAIARNQKSRKDKGNGFFASHPGTAERLDYLAKAAAAIPDPSDRTGEAEYRAAMANWWAPLIDDQIKLNDFGGTEFLLKNLARPEWTAELLYARGELYRTRGAAGDFEKAAGFYREAIAKGSALPEARRGLGLALIRSGAADEGRALLKQYVEMKPDAVDAKMMAMLAQGE